MPRTMTVSESIDISAPPEQIYALISDPTQTGNWSPENTGARVTSAPHSAATVFHGTNKRGPFRWVTECVVTVADAPSRFRFQVRKWGVGKPFLRVPVATWEYQLAPTPHGTRVTETWIDDRSAWPDSVSAVVDRLLTGGRTFAEFNRRNIAVTLKNLKAAVEAEHR
ncbi:SRPBCC family protein [Hoyosella altamirensis]|uniref:Uncharacterized protein YndB with AHSA1/START domain n=1 Tax=Hoyosella altamirensis TaxID=616997 RepID=A0A839RNZ8_9ACTN|nr:SRPBCC family protein [Hoyosella altamirensis]MBB3037918.1 uncharacterized protein YndB with AHSA1/START domain [Hoyosella altamirensis]